MKQYFIIKQLIERKDIGPHYPQIQGFIKGYENDISNNRSLDYFGEFKGEEVAFIPDLSSMKAAERVKMTDLLSCYLGPGTDLVVSTKFYSIVSNFMTSKIQVFESLIHKKNENFRYKWLHFVYNLESFVNYQKSKFSHPKKIFKKEVEAIKSQEDLHFFRKTIDKHYLLESQKLYIKHSELDFFVVGYFNQKCFVSEQLKNELEQQSLTGFVFQPSN